MLLFCIKWQAARHGNREETFKFQLYIKWNLNSLKKIHTWYIIVTFITDDITRNIYIKKFNIRLFTGVGLEDTLWLHFLKSNFKIMKLCPFFFFNWLLSSSSHYYAQDYFSTWFIRLCSKTGNLISSKHLFTSLGKAKKSSSTSGLYPPPPSSLSGRTTSGGTLFAASLKQS